MTVDFWESVGITDGVEVGLVEETWLGLGVGLGEREVLGVPLDVVDRLCVELGVPAAEAV